LGCLTGVLLALSFPPLPFFPLAFIAFVPMFYVIEEKKVNLFFFTYIVFFIYHCGVNWWIGSWQPESDKFLMYGGVGLALAHPFFFMIPIYFYRFFSKRFNRDDALTLFPFIWIAFEWLRCFGDLAYPWLTIGYTQIDNYYWVQAADLAGVWGLSFMVVFINILFVKMLFRYNEARTKGSTVKFMYLPRVKKYVIALAVLIIIPNVYGVFITSRYDHATLLKDNATIRVGLLQPNINPWRKWEHEALMMIETHKRLQDSLQRTVPPIDLAVWSETAITLVSHEFNFFHDFHYLHEWLAQTNASLLTGFADFYVYKPGEDFPLMAKPLGSRSGSMYSSFNSALMLHSYDSLFEIYHKSKLTPFSEKFPYLEVLSFAKSWFEWNVGISSWTPGERQNNLHFVKNNDTVTVAPVICIESIYPYYVREFVTKGAQVIAVITNDGWFDYTPGPEQHYLIAAMRAIENRRYIVRVANTGISGVIKPDGSSLMTLPEREQTAAAAEVPLLGTNSLYFLFGDYAGILSTVLIIITLIYSLLYKRKVQY